MSGLLCSMSPYAALTRRFRLRESLSPPSDYPLRHCLKGREALWPQDLLQGAHALETSIESTYSSSDQELNQQKYYTHLTLHFNTIL